jgi:hypothetical protein
VSSPFSDIPVATARSHDGQLTECVARGRMRVAGAVGVCEAVSGRGRAGVTVYLCSVCIVVEAAALVALALP